MDRGTVRQSFLQLLECFEDNRPNHILFTTFNFNSSFFEENVLPLVFGYQKVCRATLNDALTKTRVAVFCDRTAHPEPKGILRYGLVPLGLRNGRFHPKIILARGPLKGGTGEGMVLMVSSANLSMGGWGSNREVVGWTPIAAGHASELRRLLNWLRKQCETFYEKADDGSVRMVLEQLENGLDKLPEEVGQQLPEFHLAIPGSDMNPLLARMIGAKNPRSLRIFSPYWGSLPNILQELSIANVEFIPSLDRGGYPFPKSSLAIVKENGPKISFLKFPVSDDPARFSHAKAYFMNHGNLDDLAIGSANCTGPALLGYTEKGNVEAMLVYRGLPKDQFPTLSLAEIEIVDLELAEDEAAPELWPFEAMVFNDWSKGSFLCHYKGVGKKVGRAWLEIDGNDRLELPQDCWEKPIQISHISKRRAKSFRVFCDLVGNKEHVCYEGLVIDLNVDPIDFGYERRFSLDEVLEELQNHAVGKESSKTKQKEPSQGDDIDDSFELAGEDLNHAHAYDFYAIYRGFYHLRKRVEGAENCFGEVGGASLPRILRAVIHEEDETCQAQIRRYLILKELEDLSVITKNSEGKEKFFGELKKEVEKTRLQIRDLICASAHFQKAFAPSDDAANQFIAWFDKEICYERP